MAPPGLPATGPGRPAATRRPGGGAKADESDQTATGSALIRSSASTKASRQGRRAGRWRVTLRAERVSRPGMASRRRRKVSSIRGEAPGEPIAWLQRARLWAIAASWVQAELAEKSPEGKWARAPA